MKIKIETIPHKDQRYPTCGDWYCSIANERQITEGNTITTLVRSAGDLSDVWERTLHIRVSEEVGEDYAFLIALHELIEWKLCSMAGISERDVDMFDKGYEAARKAINPEDTSEPEDAPTAPYSAQHGFATAMEEKMASEMKVLWSEYAAAINKLP